MKRIFVSLPDGMWKIIRKNYKGVIGESDSEIIRNMVVAYLSDNGEFETEYGRGAIDEMYEQLKILQEMYSALAQSLQDKRIITNAELENKIKEQLEKRSVDNDQL